MALGAAAAGNMPPRFQSTVPGADKKPGKAEFKGFVFMLTWIYTTIYRETTDRQVHRMGGKERRGAERERKATFHRCKKQRKGTKKP